MQNSELICLGLNHENSPVEFREKLAFSERSLEPALKAAVSEQGIHEAAILSTCNRIEIYAQGCQKKGLSRLESFLHDFPKIEKDSLTPHLYRYIGASALTQLMRVTSSLDSLVLGEPQILGQVKAALAQAKEHGAAGAALEHIFSQAFYTAKRIRNETDLGKNAVTVAYAAVELAQKVFGDLKNLNCLLLGRGEMGTLAASHFEQKGSRIKLSGRDVKISKELIEADLVVASTNSSSYLIDFELVKALMPKRRYRPLFLIDISVPRNICPQVSKIDNIYLYNIDDLSEVVALNKLERRHEALRAENIISEQVASFRERYKERQLAPLIKDLQAKSKLIAQEEFKKILDSGHFTEKQYKELESLSRRLSARVFHESVEALKQSGRLLSN